MDKDIYNTLNKLIQEAQNLNKPINNELLLRSRVKQLIVNNKFTIISLSTLIIGFVGGLLAN